MFDSINMPEEVRMVLDGILTPVIILVIGLLIMKAALIITRRTLVKSSLDQVLYNFIIKVVKILVWIFIALIILESVGIKAGSVLTVLAAAGAAIALALKDSLANVAGGIMIMVNKPFVQDDYIDINGHKGEVKEIDLFVTHLNTYDNKVITIPNGLINTSVLTNYTKEDIRRVDCTFGIGYGDDIAEAKKILGEIAAGYDLILKDPEPVYGVSGHGENSVQIDFRVWCETDNYLTVKYYVEEQVKLAFDKAGITIPYPQMDVHIISGNSK